MWKLTIRSPARSPVEYSLKSGKNKLGRKPDNDIIIFDESASRTHAEIFNQHDLAVLYDLGSTNGTFVNRERISKPRVLQAGDQIRIGQHVISVTFQQTSDPTELTAALTGTRPLTRELMLESIDQHAVFMDAVATRLTMILDLDTAQREIANMMQIALGADRTGVILAEEFGQLEYLGAIVYSCRQAIEQQSIVIVPDLASQSDHFQSNDVEHEDGSVMCVPVIIEQDVIAVTYAYKKGPVARPFDRHDVQLAVALSHQVALTIQRAKLLEESRMYEKLALTDSLTGLHNRRQILRQAELEFKRSVRFNHPFSLFLMDLDNLKQINESHGHLAGDLALQTVAEVGKKQLREIDSIGRYGGDEFLVLLIETDLDGGRAAAERIRSNITNTDIKVENKVLNLTISIGIASKNEKTSNLTDILNQADKALITAKKSGKNQLGIAAKKN